MRNLQGRLEILAMSVCHGLRVLRSTLHLYGVPGSPITLKASLDRPQVSTGFALPWVHQENGNSPDQLVSRLTLPFTVKSKISDKLT
ncbi:hypothetical protein CRYUN_Cryun28dG0031100 [Craigia yunnanensis]